MSERGRPKKTRGPPSENNEESLFAPNLNISHNSQKEEQSALVRRLKDDDDEDEDLNEVERRIAEQERMLNQLVEESPPQQDLADEKN